jgi:hypothetical protein
MMKATAETYWVNRDAQNENFVSTVIPGKWFCKAKQTLRHLFLQSISRSTQSNPGMWESFILRQQQKAGITEQHTKEEFFYDSHRAGRKNIHHRAWQRHSAFLVYHQKVNNLQPGLKQNNKMSVTDARISFQVESITQLPVWATSLNEMCFIENDLSSLRFMEFCTLEPLTADVA